MIEELKSLAAVEGAYQDIVVDGKVISKGWRDCTERWRIIEPHIKSHQTVLDIGSHYGYFGMKIAAQHPSTLVWSVEEHAQRAKIQALAAEANGFSNMVVSNSSIDLLKLLKLQRTCETLDTILCLSTLHYFSIDEIPEILWAFGQLANNLIIEFPSHDELDVAERNVVQAVDIELLLNRVYDSVVKIGEAPSPKHSKAMRPIFLAQNFAVKRQRCISYLNAPVGNHHVVEFKAGLWKIDKKTKKINGLNFINLRETNLIYPALDPLFQEAGERYYRLIQKLKGQITDIHPRNLILSHNGIFPIDYTESVGKEVAGIQWNVYKRRILSLADSTQVADYLKDFWLESTNKERG